MEIAFGFSIGTLYLISVNPSRSYLILRPKDFSDPDPKLTTVLLHIWPLMILVTLANLIFLVGIAGLGGPYILPALLLMYGANYAVLRAFCKVEIQTGDLENPNDGQDAFRKENQSFIAMAALSSLWLPSVVGHPSQRIFLVSSIMSLASKVLVLALLVTFASSGLQGHIYKRPFLLFCFNEDSTTHLNDTRVTQCKYSEDTCGPPKNLTHEIRIADALSTVKVTLLEYEQILNDIHDDDLKTENPRLNNSLNIKLNKASTFLTHIRSSKAEIDETLNSAGIGRVQQKIRICEENETPFRIGVLSFLLVVLALAAYATYRLHRIADYRVFELTNNFPIFNKLISRSSLTLPKPFWAAYQARKLGLFIAHCCLRQ